ncbi:MAG: TetR/AcrR family transcriptional regulator [Gemmataceae bacterium]
MTLKKVGRPRDEALQARRQEEILDAAAALFARNGYPNTDVQQVADALGVGKGTVYRYFPSKEELFLAAVDRGIRQMEDYVHGSVEGVADHVELIVQAIRAYLVFFDENPQLLELFVQERAEFRGRKKPAYFAQREAGCGASNDFLRSLIAAGRLRDIPVERIRDVSGDLLFGTVFANTLAGRRPDPDEQARQITDILFHGILTDKERKHHAR